MLFFLPTTHHPSLTLNLYLYTLSKQPQRQRVHFLYIFRVPFSHYLLDPEAGVLHHVPDHGHDLGRELPLLLSEGGAGRAGVLQPVGQEHVVGRHMRKQGQPKVQGSCYHFCTLLYFPLKVESIQRILSVSRKKQSDSNRMGDEMQFLSSYLRYKSEKT